MRVIDQKYHSIHNLESWYMVEIQIEKGQFEKDFIVQSSYIVTKLSVIGSYFKYQMHYQ